MTKMVVVRVTVETGELQAESNDNRCMPSDSVNVSCIVIVGTCMWATPSIVVIILVEVVVAVVVAVIVSCSYELSGGSGRVGGCPSS